MKIIWLIAKFIFIMTFFFSAFFSTDFVFFFFFFLIRWFSFICFESISTGVFDFNIWLGVVLLYCKLHNYTFLHNRITYFLFERRFWIRLLQAFLFSGIFNFLFSFSLQFWHQTGTYLCDLINNGFKIKTKLFLKKKKKKKKKKKQIFFKGFVVGKNVI